MHMPIPAQAPRHGARRAGRRHVALAVTACGSGGGGRTAAARQRSRRADRQPVRHVRLRGVGPVRRVREPPPRHHDQVRVDAERGQVLAGAADPAQRRQRPRRHPGHRGRPHPRRRDQPGRQVDRPARHLGGRPASAATSTGRRRPPPPPTARCSASAPTSARWASATAPTCSGRPACRPTPPRSPRRCATWDDYLALGEKYKAAAPGGHGLDRLGGRALQRDHLHRAEDLLRRVGRAGLRRATRPCRQAFDTAAEAGQAGLTAKLEQFVDPGWNQGFGSGSFATIACPSWMIGYIKGKAGDAGAGKWNVTDAARRRGRQLGRLVPRASPRPASTRRRPPS